MTKRPLQYPIYKGVKGNWGALQFNFQAPHYYRDREKDFTGRIALDASGKIEDGWRQREGAVFVEAATATGPNIYDWENKITFACSVTDMGKLILGLTTGDSTDIMHDPGARGPNEGKVRKHLKLYSSKGITKGGCMITVSLQEGDKNMEHKIPMSPDECLVLRQLLLTAVSKALAW